MSFASKEAGEGEIRTRSAGRGRAARTDVLRERLHALAPLASTSRRRHISSTTPGVPLAQPHAKRRRSLPSLRCTRKSTAERLRASDRLSRAARPAAAAFAPRSPRLSTPRACPRDGVPRDREMEPHDPRTVPSMRPHGRPGQCNLSTISVIAWLPRACPCSSSGARRASRGPIRHRRPEPSPATCCPTCGENFVLDDVSTRRHDALNPTARHGARLLLLDAITVPEALLQHLVGADEPDSLPTEPWRHA